MATLKRTAEVVRKTRETDIAAALCLDGGGDAKVNTGIGFLDHMLCAWAFWARFDLELRCDGDLEVDDHHTVEDVALVLGEAVDRALGDRVGIARFGEALVPMDEALARCVIDLSGRPFAIAELDLQRERIGQLATENVTHWFWSFAVTSRSTLHVDVLRGENDHHRIEASFKAMGRALRQAVSVDSDIMPSTKGRL